MMRKSEPPPPPPAKPVVQTIPTSDVLVAAADLPMGQTLRVSDLRWQPWPADTVPPGYIIRSQNPAALDQTVGSIARSNFLSGEPIRREKLIKADGSGFMSAILPSGMRAVAISIDTRGATSAGGFILPNDRVDVLRTYRDDDASRSGGGDVHLTETILSNIRVLAIGQNVQERNGEKVVTGETATLELTPGQAEIVTLAQKVGQLSLALRSLADAGRVEEVKEERDAGLTIVRYGVPKHSSKR
jgi:pilus assembly protein CpaB